MRHVQLVSSTHHFGTNGKCYYCNVRTPLYLLDMAVNDGNSAAQVLAMFSELNLDSEYLYTPSGWIVRLRSCHTDSLEIEKLMLLIKENGLIISRELISHAFCRDDPAHSE